MNINPNQEETWDAILELAYDYKFKYDQTPDLENIRT